MAIILMSFGISCVLRCACHFWGGVFSAVIMALVMVFRLMFMGLLLLGGLVCFSFHGWCLLDISRLVHVWVFVSVGVVELVSYSVYLLVYLLEAGWVAD